MTGEFNFYTYAKYGTTINAVLNPDGHVMVHKTDDGFDYKQTDILHVIQEFDNILLRPSGKVHISDKKLKTIKSALEDFMVAHNVMFSKDNVNNLKFMKALYNVCINEEPDEDDMGDEEVAV